MHLDREIILFITVYFVLGTIFSSKVIVWNVVVDSLFWPVKLLWMAFVFFLVKKVFKPTK